MRLGTKKNKDLQCIQLTELKAMFDAAIRNGKSFSDVKKIYLRIKNLRQYLNSFNVE